MADIKKLKEQVDKQKEKVEREKAKLSQLETQLQSEYSKQDKLLKERYECITEEQLEEALKEWHMKHILDSKEKEE